MLNTAKKSVAF